MKKLTFVFVMFICLTTGYAQNCDNLTVKTDAQAKAAEPCVVKAADYLLSNPLHSNNSLTRSNGKLIVEWMTATPDYTFTITGKLAGLLDNDDNILLLSIFNACMSKAALQTKGDFGKEGMKLFVEYIKKTENGVKQTPKIKKLLSDYEKGDIEKYYKQ